MDVSRFDAFRSTAVPCFMLSPQTIRKTSVKSSTFGDVATVVLMNHLTTSTAGSAAMRWISNLSNFVRMSPESITVFLVMLLGLTSEKVVVPLDILRGCDE